MRSTFAGPAKALLVALVCGLGGSLVLPSASAQTRSRNANDGSDASDVCQTTSLRMAVFGPDDVATRTAFGVRVFSAYAEAIAQAQQAMGVLTERSAVAPSQEQMLGRLQSMIAPGGGPTGTLQALQRGNFDAARAQWTAALEQARRDGRPLAEATALNDLGTLDALQGRGAAARERFDNARRLFAGLSARGSATTDAAKSQLEAQMAGMAAAQQSEQAMREWAARLRSMVLAASLGGGDGVAAHSGHLVALLNLANITASLGQRAEAETLFKQALELTNVDPVADADSGTSPLRALALADIAVFYRKAGRPAQAEPFARQAREAGDVDQPSALPMWLLADAGHAATGGVPSDNPGADPCGTQDAVREQPLGFAEAGYRWINAEAQRREAAGDIAAAMQAHGRAAFLSSVIGSPERERAAWAALQRLATARGEGAAAVLYGKLAVNAAQRLRGGVETLSRQARQAYLAERRAPYVTLAIALLDAGRLAEAELVLRLLKEDEGQQFVVDRSGFDRGSVPLSRAEADWVRRFDALVAQTRTLYAERQRVLEATWAGYGVAAGRAQQEKLIVEGTLDGAEQIVASLDQPQKDEGQLRRDQALLAKPRAARTAQEQEQIDALQVLATRLLARLEEVAAGLRSLPREAESYRVPLSAAQAQRAAAIERRLPAVRALWATTFSVFAAEPAPQSLSPAARMAVGLLDGAIGGQTDQLRRRWALDRQIEARDADSSALRERLTSELNGTVAPSFDAAAEAQLAQGQRTLAELPAGTVAVYYLQGDQRLDALVVGAARRRALRLAGERVDLEARISRYRNSVERRSLDLLPEARGLYDTLWRPLEPALREAQAQTVMLSLDGALRVLPFAALHDGEHWLVERYALDIYTSAARAALTARPAPRWRIAAFGASAGGQINGEALKALPGVRGELAAIVQSAAGAAPRGVVPGAAWLDQAFTAAALRQVLRDKPPQRASVVHLASHFVFEPGDAQRSALLLGDGSALSLAELGSAGYRFDKVDLVTLSACRTALSADDPFGQQVEGLGTLLQAQGAAAVLATLWSVDDGSTAAFMAAMYVLRERDGLTRAEAVRQAQLDLIRGRISPQSTTPPPRLRSGGRDDDGAGEGSGPWAHPFHWAPFVLMGNWL